VTTDDLIVQLAQSAGPVQPLPAPSARLARWTIRALLVTAASVLVIGARPDVMPLMQDAAFVGLAAVTLLTGLASAFCAFVLSIPGAERTSAQRVFPFVAAAAWIAGLTVLLQADGGSPGRVLALPIHPLCIFEIAALGVIPGWTLFTMLRQAAPLESGWTAAFATLAAVAFGAAGTQLLCPIDDPAHHLAGHVGPVALYAVAGAFLFRGSLQWFRPGADR
jgi:hypothetical protein